MEEETELEDGEIEDISDAESLVEEIKIDPSSSVRNKNNSRRTPNFKNKRRHHSFESWRTRKCSTNFRKNSQPALHMYDKNAATEDDVTKYDMDDYELLLARHHLIQQQLNKVNDEGLVKNTKISLTDKVIKVGKSKSTNNYKCDDVKSLKENKNLVEHVSVEDNEDELLMLRNVLLAQTKTKRNSVNSENDVIPNTYEKIVPSTNDVVLKSENISSTVEFDKDIDRNTMIEENKTEQKVLRLRTDVSVLVKKLDPDIIFSVPSQQLWQQSDVSKKPKKKQTKKKQRNKTIQTRSQVAKSVNRRNIGRNGESNLSLDNFTGRKKKRGGKRAKYLAYRAQQKIETELELEILKQQQEEVDNYSTVPMDIEDDDSAGLSDGKAPLPLIETTELIPPPPPSTYGFQPVPDQTALSMTHSNVLWMPGYVESLDINSQKPAQPLPPALESVEEVVINKRTDEIDIWALRAQALKSLACKRAAKAKKINKQKMFASSEEKVAQRQTHTNTSMTTEVKLPATPVMNKKSNNFVAPPQHPPVIIRLSKDDFGTEDSSANDVNLLHRKALDEFRIEGRQEINQTTKRRKSVSDENILKELQSIAEKVNLKVKKHSSYIVKDQLAYKKLQSVITEKRTLFQKQCIEVKKLQEKLQIALKEKATTQGIHNKLHNQIKQVKDELKQKISMKKSTDEEILRARSIVSVNRLKLNGKGTISDKMKQNMTSLVRSLQISHQKLMKFEKLQDNSQSSQDDSDFSSDYQHINNSVSRSTTLMETAADVKNMTKQDLAKLELQLREQLNQYRITSQQNITMNSAPLTGSNVLPDESDKLTLLTLPLVQSLKDLVALQKKLSKGLCKVASQPCCNFTLQELLHVKQKLSSLKHIKVISQTAESSTSREVEGCFEQNALFTKYQSMLIRFKSYRLNPYFRTQSKHAIQSPTFSNTIEAQRIMCKFDLLGTCNDDHCTYWHFQQHCCLSTDDIIKDLVAYDLHAFNATPNMGGETKRKLLNSFTKQFTAQYSGKMTSDEKLLLLWNQLKETRRSRKQPAYECIMFDKRGWLLWNRNKSKMSAEKQHVEQYTSNKPVYYLKRKKKQMIGSVEIDESQEVRYFDESYDSVEVLKAVLAKNPTDVKLWLALAHQVMKRKTGDGSAVVSNTEEALSVLSQGLEENRDSEELWIRYLHLFATNSTVDELRELCYQAVMYAATYNVWWTCLNLEATYSGKQEICSEMVKFILESDEVTKSHILLETILYACQLLTYRGKLATAMTYISAALNRGEVVDDTEKLQMGGVTSYLNIADQSILWMCFISLQVFHCLPSCLFKVEETTPGRLVNKKKFLLEWDNKSWNIDKETIRMLFQDALQVEKEISSSSTKAVIILYDNWIAFELSLGNVETAVSKFRTLVDDKPSFIEGWVLLLSLYIHHSPMDAVVTVAEQAIHRCDHDVEIIYLYTSWLFKQGMPSLALEKLTKCIHVYFQFDENDSEVADVLLLYRKVLGLPVPHTLSLPTYLPSLQTSQHLIFYYWSCYCLLLKIKKTPSVTSTFSTATDEAFESAVHQYITLENTRKLWTVYIEHKLDTISLLDSVSLKEYEELEDLLFRSLCVRANALVPHNKSITWKDYSFHNKVLHLCLAVIPAEKHSHIYQKALNLMPDNVELALRVCQHELKKENYEQARIICSSLLMDSSRCLQLWQTAIQVELKCNCVQEARWLYQEATKSLPFCSTLWKDFASFEIIYSKADKLDEVLNNIIRSAFECGVELKEVLATNLAR